MARVFLHGAFDDTGWLPTHFIKYGWEDVVMLSLIALYTRSAYKGGDEYEIFFLRREFIFKTEYISQQYFTFSLKPAIPESKLFQDPTNTGMANNAVWQVLHFLCILAHIGMFAAGIATFAVNGVGDVTGGDDEPGDYATHVAYPWAVGGIGIAGAFVNAAIFYRLLKVSKTLDQGTRNDQYFKRKVAFTASMIIQTTMTAADIAIGGVVAGKVSQKGDLAAPCALAFIAGAVSLATGVADISQFSDYRQRKEAVENNSFEISDA